MQTTTVSVFDQPCLVRGLNLDEIEQSIECQATILFSKNGNPKEWQLATVCLGTQGEKIRVKPWESKEMNLTTEEEREFLADLSQLFVIETRAC